MQKRNALPRLAWGLVIALALVMTQKVQAVTLSIQATAACVDRDFLITYTASVSGNGGVSNPSVNILFDGAVVDNGAFVAPSFTFGDTLDAPAGKGAGDTVTVSLNVIGTWSNGTLPGDAANVATTTVTLPAEGCADGIGRFTGGGTQSIVGLAKVTRGLTIHCDLLLSNNLEINWDGNHFHMLEHLTTVACTDDPAIEQKPPKAPLDTLVGTGTGRYNGVDGYTVEFTLIDGGEPGKGGVDQMAILIYETANPGNIVLNVPLQGMATGNLQAHYDQPHGSNWNK
jgi:hypothetical protein